MEQRSYFECLCLHRKLAEGNFHFFWRNSKNKSIEQHPAKNQAERMNENSRTEAIDWLFKEIA